jgi:hypothetical protein
MVVEGIPQGRSRFQDMIAKMLDRKDRGLKQRAVDSDLTRVCRCIAHKLKMTRFARFLATYCI